MIQISIIIPIFNTAAFLSQCIKSVLEQTYSCFEIIAVDDNSTDNSKDIVQAFAVSDSRIILLTQNTNRGAGAARNSGMEAAKGNYILFLDSDDYLSDKTALEKLYNRAISGDADIVLFKHNLLDTDTGRIDNMISVYERSSWKRIENNPDIEKNYSINDAADFLLAPAYPWNKFYKKDLLIKNRITCTETFCHNDLALSWKSMITAQKISFLPESLVLHRHAPTLAQLTNDKSRRRLDLFRATADVDSFLTEKNISKKIYSCYIKFKYDCFTWSFPRISPDYQRLFFRLIKKHFNNTPASIRKIFIRKFIKSRKEKIKFMLLRYSPALYLVLKKIFGKGN